MVEKMVKIYCNEMDEIPKYLVIYRMGISEG